MRQNKTKSEEEEEEEEEKKEESHTKFFFSKPKSAQIVIFVRNYLWLHSDFK